MTQPQHSTSIDPTAPPHAEVSLPAPRSSGVSIGIVIALVIAALGVGFLVGRLVGALG